MWEEQVVRGVAAFMLRVGNARTKQVSDGSLCAQVENVKLLLYISLQIPVGLLWCNVQWLVLLTKYTTTMLLGEILLLFV